VVILREQFANKVELIAAGIVPQISQGEINLKDWAELKRRVAESGSAPCNGEQNHQFSQFCDVNWSGAKTFRALKSMLNLKELHLATRSR